MTYVGVRVLTAASYMSSNSFHKYSPSYVCIFINNCFLCNILTLKALSLMIVSHRLFSFFFIVSLLFVGCSAFDLENEPQEKLGILQENQFGSVTCEGEAVYYYYFDERVYLKERKDIIAICFQNEQALQRFISEQSSLFSLKVWGQSSSGNTNEPNPYNLLIVQSLGIEISEGQRKELASLPEVLYVSPMFGENDRHLTSVSDEFSVKLRKRIDYSRLENMAQEHGCAVLRYEGFNEDIYLVKRPKESELGTIQLSAFFYETGLFEFTSPGFFWFGGLSSLDPDYSKQWGLKNTGQNGSGTSGVDINIEQAWNITQGSSEIIVAVIDNGVELTHPDLAANLISGYDATTHQQGGGPVLNGDSHGTMVAGIIGAVKDNNIGISGVAPGCRIMPIRGGSYNTNISSQVFYSVSAAESFDWARTHGADVINCSWSSVDYSCSLLTTAINNATNFGRNGKGCVVVFSSGNDWQSSVSYPGYLNNVLAVGAISYTGYRCPFSNYGNSLDIVAPGDSIRTTSPQGSYTYATGTSFAAPHVSGIAALLLSEYPDLTASQVRRALELGCTYTSGYFFHEDDNYPAGLWNNEVGYGRADAYNALLWAEFAHETNVTDGISGFDFTLTNNSSYDVWALFVGLTGDISNYNEMLIFHDPGDVDSGKQVGYPFYRGENLSATPGTPVSNIWLELFAMTPNYYGDLRIGVAIDNPTPTTYTTVSFGDGDTVFLNLPNSTVPNASRRRVYIDVKDPLP